MSILGVDVGSYACGWAVLEGTNIANSKVLAYGLIAPQDNWEFLRRVAYIEAQVSALLTEHKPRKVIFERIRLFHGGGINLEAIKDLAAVEGVLGVLAERANIPVIEAHTSHLRKSVIGDGRAKKEDVVRWVVEKYGITTETDTAEAIAIGAFGLIPEVKVRARAKARR